MSFLETVGISGRFSTRPPGAISGAKTVGPALLRRFTYDMYVVTITGVTLRLFTYNNMYVVTKTGVTWRRPARKAANFMPADSARQAENSAQVASDGCTSLFVAALFPRLCAVRGPASRSSRPRGPGLGQDTPFSATVTVTSLGFRQDAGLPPRLLPAPRATPTASTT
ncbi:hypothetical protein THAOC_28870, partial [Thalassiosira oceanica]